MSVVTSSCYSNAHRAYLGCLMTCTHNTPLQTLMASFFGGLYTDSRVRSSSLLTLERQTGGHCHCCMTHIANWRFHYRVLKRLPTCQGSLTGARGMRSSDLSTSTAFSAATFSAFFLLGPSASYTCRQLPCCVWASEGCKLHSPARMCYWLSIACSLLPDTPAVKSLELGGHGTERCRPQNIDCSVSACWLPRWSACNTCRQTALMTHLKTLRPM